MRTMDVAIHIVQTWVGNTKLQCSKAGRHPQYPNISNITKGLLQYHWFTIDSLLLFFSPTAVVKEIRCFSYSDILLHIQLPYVL